MRSEALKAAALVMGSLKGTDAVRLTATNNVCEIGTAFDGDLIRFNFYKDPSRIALADIKCEHGTVQVPNVVSYRNQGDGVLEAQSAAQSVRVKDPMSEFNDFNNMDNCLEAKKELERHYPGKLQLSVVPPKVLHKRICDHLKDAKEIE